MADGAQQNGRGRHHRVGHIDEKWPEVMFINDYAVFMGYLSMAVTGTGFLVFTWSTVVLLGGFVSMLAKKDFWSLTVITLVQTRIFDVFLNGNISYFGYSLKRLWKAALSVALPQKTFKKWSVRGLIRVLVFSTVLCPLFALYMFGLFVSPLISLWRLVEQDFGDIAGDSSRANLRPALLVVYSLALLQGVLFCYKAISSLEEQRLLKLVATEYSLGDEDKARESLSDYLRETRVGCEKNPSFARGRNLITYAAELINSNSPENYISGARILDTFIRQMLEYERRHTGTTYCKTESESESSGGTGARTVVLQQKLMVEGQRMLINNMIAGSASSGAIEKLVQMLDSRSQDDTADIRLRAMRIVAYFAGEIRLNKVPYGIQCISSFLDKSDACEHKDTSIDILLKLSNDKENLRLMRGTNDLALKVIKLLAVDSDDHDKLGDDSAHHEWCSSVAVPGMVVIKRFIMSDVVTTTRPPSNNDMQQQLPCGMSESTEAISTLEDMLECRRCKTEEALQNSVIVVVTQILVSMDSTYGVGADRHKAKVRLISSLVGMFLDDSNSRSSSLKKLAVESLAQLSRTSEESAMLILQDSNKNGVNIVDSLAKVVLDVSSKYRRSAAFILEHLCRHYTPNDNSFKKLKSALIEEQAIPEVLIRELLGRPIMSAAEPQQTSPSSPQLWTTPSYYDPSHHPPAPRWYTLDEVEVQEALSSLCATVHRRLISVEPDLRSRFDKIAADISNDTAKKFGALLEAAAEAVAEKRRFLPPPIVVSCEEDPNACCIM